jgi:hypothetical protein
MTQIIEQDEPLELAEDEEFGELSELSVAPEEPTDETVDEADVKTEVVAETIPEKFRGKSIEDVIHSYEESEKALGRKNNEVGELRKLTDQILQQNLQLNDGGTPAKETLEVDDLLENPQQAIANEISNNPAVKALEAQLVEAKRGEAQRNFETKHPTGMATMTSPEVLEWVAASPVRARLYREASENYDFELADELLTMYEGVQGVKVTEAQEQRSDKRDKALQAATTERGSSGQAPKKVYKRVDLAKMMHSNRDGYDDPVFQAELAKAYQDGRVR